MNYIFHHEQLRLDEIMKKISAKSNFSPLKPLKSYRNYHQYSKRHISVHGPSSIQNSPKTLKAEKFFPLLPKLSNNSSLEDSRLSNSNQDIMNYLETKKKHREYLDACNNRDLSVKLERLPDILKNKNYSLDSKRGLKLSKKKKLIITHIPSVSYFQEQSDKKKNPLSYSLNV